MENYNYSSPMTIKIMAICAALILLNATNIIIIDNNTMNLINTASSWATILDIIFNKNKK